MYDICVIGGGPGGYVAALRAGRQGAGTCLIERDRLGGTCLNRGCIPVKTLLQTARFYDSIKEMADFGVSVRGGAEVDWTRALENKDARVDGLVGGVAGLLKRAGVDVIRGEAHFADRNTVTVNGEKIESRNFIIATGSLPFLPPVSGMDLPGIMTSDEALAVEKLPASIVIIGGGVIGAELGQMFLSLGSEVTIVEAEPHLLPHMDREASDALKAHLLSQGAEILTEAKVTGAAETGEEYSVSVRTQDGDRVILCEKVLVVTGRKAENGPAVELGLKTDRGFISVDEHFRTSVPGIYAVGDVTGIGMLAHSAYHQGIHAADHALGKNSGPSYRFTPICVYTAPELASVGMTEDEAREKHGDILVGRFPFFASGRALTTGRTEGFVKILAEKEHHRILGVHIVGDSASEMISEAALAMEMECTAEDLMNTIHPHPTMSEAVMEAAYQLAGMGIHI
ncbi:MAG: dihydrolipoyl dehydrogenase [Emergencia sp.]